MMDRVLAYVSGWSPGLHSGVFRELGLTVSSQAAHWYAAFERHVALGRPLNSQVTAYASRHADDELSVLTWNLRASMSGSNPAPDLLPAQLEVILQGLARPAVLCLQEVCFEMMEHLPLHGYEVLSCELVYAEIDAHSDAGRREGKPNGDSQRPHRPSKRAKRKHSTHRPAAVSLDAIASAMQRDSSYRPAFSGWNVIAVRRSWLDRLVVQRGPTVLLRQYDARVVEGTDVLERRLLSSVQLTFAHRALAPLLIYNTHLHAEPGADGLDERYAEMRIICQQLTQPPVSPSEGLSAASAAGSSRPPSARSLAPPPPPPFLLCGDLNACSERDYTPGEQYMMYSFSGLHMPQEHNYWAVLELLEEQLAMDSFALARLPRPKISCWSCRRVDHILSSTQAALQQAVTHSAVYYTLASDHLPVICWMRMEPTSAAAREPTICPGQ